MLRKIITFVLLFCLCFGSAYAAPPITSKTKNVVIPPKVGLTQKTYSIQTEFEGIKKSVDGYYALEVESGDGKVMVTVGKLEIDLKDKESYEKLMEKSSVSEQAKEQIRSAIKAGATSVGVFSSFLLEEQEQAKLAQSMSPQNIPIPDPGWYYPIYNGVECAMEVLQFYSLDTGTKRFRTGSDVHQHAGDTIEFFITAAGIVSTPIAYLDTGLSLLEFFLNKWGIASVAGSRQDFIEGKIKYNLCVKNTFAKNALGAWQLGSITRCAVVFYTYTYEYMFFYKNGVGRTEHAEIIRGALDREESNWSATQPSKNFLSPFANAIANVVAGTTNNERLYWKPIPTLSFTFTLE